MNDLTTGEMFAIARRRKGMFQGELTKLTRLNKVTIYNLEHGSNATIRTMRAVAKALGYRLVIELEEIEK